MHNNGIAIMILIKMNFLYLNYFIAVCQASIFLGQDSFYFI